MSAFDQLVQDAKARRSEDAMRAVYEKLLNLPSWFMLGSRDEPNKPVLWPFTVHQAEEGERTQEGEGGQTEAICLLAFTDTQQAARTAQAIGCVLEDKTVPVIRTAVPQAVEWMRTLTEHGVTRAMFNPHGESFPLRLADAPVLHALFMADDDAPSEGGPS
ncbi:MAG: hypothetical protein ABL309_09970 [Phycisphaerales bacterium]